METTFLLLLVSSFVALETAGVVCPCHTPSLCDPIADLNRKEIFVFSLQNKNSSWMKFDWKKITTVVTVGYVSQDLMCYAHQRGTRVVTIANFPLSNLTNPKTFEPWIKEQLSIVKSNFYDGINIDFEDVILKNQSDVKNAYTQLVLDTYTVFKLESIFYQVTVDVAWSPDCIDLRCYDSLGLASVSDFLFVMAYDEQSQILGDCVALANSHFNKTYQGLQRYLSLGVDPSKLVLGVPWYGYDYTCLSLSQDNVCAITPVPFRGVNCSDAAGRQIDYRVIYPLLINGSTSGRLWDNNGLSPFFNYKEQPAGEMHQVRYDDPQSLTLKYNLAEKLQLRGVGTWNIDCLDFSDAPYAQQQTSIMFGAFPTYPR